LGLALKGIEIPLEEKLKTLKLDQLSSLAGGQKFTRKAPAVEYLMDVPDIVRAWDFSYSLTFPLEWATLGHNSGSQIPKDNIHTNPDLLKLKLMIMKS
jgi:hypothetical protein